MQTDRTACKRIALQGVDRERNELTSRLNFEMLPSRVGRPPSLSSKRNCKGEAPTTREGQHGVAHTASTRARRARLISGAHHGQHSSHPRFCLAKGIDVVECLRTPV